VIVNGSVDDSLKKIVEPQRTRGMFETTLWTTIVDVPVINLDFFIRNLQKYFHPSNGGIMGFINYAIGL
jgi:hypothetical protein